MSVNGCLNFNVCNICSYHIRFCLMPIFCVTVKIWQNVRESHVKNKQLGKITNLKENMGNERTNRLHSAHPYLHSIYSNFHNELRSLEQNRKSWQIPVKSTVEVCHRNTDPLLLEVPQHILYLQGQRLLDYSIVRLEENHSETFEFYRFKSVECVRNLANN